MAKDKNLNRWLVQPHSILEKDAVTKLVEQVISDYNEAHDEEGLCLSDSDEVLYFIHFPDPDSPMHRADVAVFDGTGFQFLPEELSFNLALAYISHVKLLGDAYEFLDIPR